MRAQNENENLDIQGSRKPVAKSPVASGDECRDLATKNNEMATILAIGKKAGNSRLKTSFSRESCV